MTAERTITLLVAVALAACSHGEPIQSWQREGMRVTLPNGPLRDLPWRDEAYALTADVAVPLGSSLTLIVDCYHGELTATVDGTRLLDIGDAGVGEHRYLIGPELTGDGRLAIRLDTDRELLSALGFGVAPRLVPGSQARPTPVARFNRYAAIIELGLIFVFSALFGTLYALDRRRRDDATFALGSLAVAVGPLWQLGVLQAVLGAWAASALGIAICISHVAVLYFLHFGFGAPAPPRWTTRAYAVLAVATPVCQQAPFSAGVIIVVYLITSVAFFLWASRMLLRIAHVGPRRGDARILMIAIAFTALAVTPDVLGELFGYALLHGAHTVALGAVTFPIAQALVLVRHQVERQRKLEHTAAELQRQVAERSRELSDALARLAQPATVGEGRVIDGRYRVVRKIGAGGMGTVYEVERTGDGERLALKTMRARGAPDLMARFAREAQIAAEIVHPNLVSVIDIGIADGALFLVMPLIAGGSLEQARARFGDAAWATPVLAQIARGLAALHERGVVHRDLKPGNVLLAGGVARIADFGLAHMTDGEQTLPSLDDAYAATAAPLTRAGDVFGTPRYMAPELARGAHAPAPSSDVFAFGVIAVELLANRAPFAEPPVLARLDGRTPAAATLDGVTHRELLARCLGLDPEQRPTADELVRAFSA